MLFVAALLHRTLNTMVFVPFFPPWILKMLNFSFTFSKYLVFNVDYTPPSPKYFWHYMYRTLNIYFYLENAKKAYFCHILKTWGIFSQAPRNHDTKEKRVRVEEGQGSPDTSQVYWRISSSLYNPLYSRMKIPSPVLTYCGLVSSSSV